jgi:hypothetical protein
MNERFSRVPFYFISSSIINRYTLRVLRQRLLSHYTLNVLLYPRKIIPDVRDVYRSQSETYKTTIIDYP